MSYQTKMKSWLANNTAGSTLITVVEFTHPDIGSRAINDYGIPLTVKDEGGSDLNTNFVPFTFKLPTIENTTKQSLTINMDNTSGIPYSILKDISSANKQDNALKVYVRFYLDDDLTASQLDPPLRLEVEDATCQNSTVKFQCVAPFMRKYFNGMLYKANLFPTLYSFWS